MKEVLKLNLTYSGADVDDGSMSIEDIVPALQGFSSAYGKIVAWKGIETKHNIRITGVKKGSFTSLIEVWEWIGGNAQQLESIGATVGGATGVVLMILDIINLKKHTKGQAYTEKIVNQPTKNVSVIAVQNSDNVTLEVPVETFAIFKEGLLDQDLSKIVRPIQSGRIESAHIIAESEERSIEASITAEEKPYFDLEVVTVTKTQEVWLAGTFNSLTKSTNKGYFILTDGTRVSYKLSNDRPEDLYKYFLYKGAVKVRCIANMDENLKVSSLDVFEVQNIQTNMFALETTDEDSDE